MTNLWFHYVVPSLKNNGATMVLGAMFLPLVKKYLKADPVAERVWAVLKRLLAAVKIPLRVRVTLSKTPPQAPQAGSTMASK